MPCILRVRLIGSIPVDAGRGMVYPLLSSTLVHGVQVETGFIKVQVDMINDIFKTVPLEKPPNEEIKTLGDAVHTFVQWPKRDIALDLSVPRSPHPVSQEGHRPGPVTSAPVAPPPAPVRKPVASAPAETPPRTYRKRGYKTQGKKNKPPVPWKFTLGVSLVPESQLPRLGMICNTLHAWYMQKSNMKPIRQSAFTVKYTEQHFLHDTGYIVVTFEDLFLLFNLDELDASLLRCWTL